MKKLFMILVLALLMAALCTTAYGAVGDTFYGVPFFDDDTASVDLLYEIISEPTGSEIGGKVKLIKSDEITYSESSYEIPGFVKNPADTSKTPYVVVEIGDSAFNNCTSLKSVIIPDGVTKIGRLAFYNCTELTSVELPDSIATIGEYAFCQCKSLTDITLPSGVTTIDGNAFAYCINMTSITIPDGVTKISDGAFAQCHSLQNITIPDRVTAIGAGAFSGCQSFTSVTIPSNVASIGTNAFHNCVNITSILIPVNVTTIGNTAFGYCNNLTAVTILYDKDKNIADNAFENAPATIIHKLATPVVTVDESTQTISWTGLSGGIADAYEITFYNAQGVQQTNSTKIQETSINYVTVLSLAGPGNYYCTVRAFDDIKFIGDDIQPSDLATSAVFSYGVTERKLGTPVVMVDESTQTISWKMDTAYSTYADAYNITFYDENGVQQTNTKKITDTSIYYPQWLMNEGKYYCTITALDDIQFINEVYQPSDPARSVVFTYTKSGTDDKPGGGDDPSGGGEQGGNLGGGDEGGETPSTGGTTTPDSGTTGDDDTPTGPRPSRPSNIVSSGGATIRSPHTFDGGVAVYAALTLSSALGASFVMGKRKG